MQSTNQQIQRVPIVEIGGQDIAPYIYGNASRVIIKDGEKFYDESHPDYSWNAGQRVRPEAEHLREINRQIARQKSLSMYGIRLKPVTRVQVGDRIMNLTARHDCLSKTIFEVVDVHPHPRCQGDFIVVTRTLFPTWSEGFSGFYPMSSMSKFENWNYGYGPSTYLLMEGEWTIPENREPSLFEEMCEYASDLSALIECWAMVMSPELRVESESAWGHDLYVSYWGPEFNRRHGSEFKHILVERILCENVLQELRLDGINEIYDDHRKRWYAFGTPHDLITPLLAEMQDDILLELFRDESLAAFIFNDGGEYWRRKMQVIFEKYYGPKNLVHTKKELGRSDYVLDSKMQKRLNLLGRIIETSHHEGERAEAQRVFKKLAGYEYGERSVVARVIIEF